MGLGPLAITIIIITTIIIIIIIIIIISKFPQSSLRVLSLLCVCACECVWAALHIPPSSNRYRKQEASWAGLF